MISLLLDTNLLIEEPNFAAISDPDETVALYTSTLCYAELVEGEFSNDPSAAAAAVLQLAAAQAALGDGLPFGTPELTAYRAICAAVVGRGRGISRARRVDMMIAATALANGLTLATRNADDFAGLDAIVPIVAL